MIYFDNAATSGKKPAVVINAVKKAMSEYSANPGRSGHKLSVKAAEAVYKAREKAANFFGSSSPSNVVFTSGCTESINFVLKGVLNPNDHIIISSLEHNAVLRPVVKMGVPYTVASVSLCDDYETLKNFEKAIKPNTKMIFCTLASNVTGKILPVKKIGELCHKKGILFGVDAAQGAGVLPINMTDMNIDFLCVAAHKGLLAPMGIGILIAEKEINETIIEGGTGSNSLEYTQPLYLPEKLESGTLNLPGILGVLKGIEYIENLKQDKIYAHEMKLTQYAYKRLSQNPKIILYTPFPEKDMYTAVIPFNFLGASSEKTADFLDKHGIATRGGYHCAPLAHNHIKTLDSGAVRISFSCFNTVSEVEEFLRVINKQKM